MKCVLKALASTLLIVPALGAAEKSPIAKVLQLLTDLQSKIIAEGEEAQKTYNSFAEWCEERSKSLGFEIKTGKAEVADLKAAIEEEAATQATLDAKMEKLAAASSTNEADLKAASAIRKQEASDFAATSKELGDIIDTLRRAIGILEKEMQKGGASMLQVNSAKSLAEALTALVDASAMSMADAKQLTALVQSSEDDGDAGAPEADAYKGQSGGIISTLEDLMDKAEAQLSEARKKETEALHSFQLLKQSLEDEKNYAEKEMTEAKTSLAASNEKKASAEGDLQATSADLKEDIKTLGDLHHNCMGKAQDFEAETKSRAEELDALAAAKKSIAEQTGGTAKRSYGLNQVALFQVSRTGVASSVDLAKYETVRFIRELAKKQQSTALAQLAARISSVTRKGGEDPFGKVEGLISSMIERLEGEALAEANKKAYCDKELAENNGKKDDKTAEIEKLSVKIDGMSSRSSELKAEVASLEKALAELTKSQAQMDKMRQTEKADYAKAKADMENGLKGVKYALKVLRDYYGGNPDKAHNAAEGAGSGIVGLLEVVESDFSRSLVELTSTEEAAQATYDKETKDNQVEKATKSQDVKYKTKEAGDLDKAVAEASTDRSGVQSELGAVEEYLKSLEKDCIGKAESFEERKAAFEAELAGLKEALNILNGEAVLLQQRSSRRTLRVVREHAQ